METPEPSAASDDKFTGGTEVRPDARANEKPVPARDAATSHGAKGPSRSAYARGCRCAECREHHRVYHLAWSKAHPDAARRRRYTECPECGGRMTRGNGSGRDPERCAKCKVAAYDQPHGTKKRYDARRCRCDDCRAANTAYYRDLRARKAQVAA